MKRVGYRSLYQLSETISDGGTGLAASEEILVPVFCEFCSQGQIFSVVKTGQGAPTPAAQVNFLMTSVIGKKEE